MSDLKLYQPYMDLPILTPEEEHELAVRYYEFGDIEAAQELTIRNMRFVYSMVHKFKYKPDVFQDLIQEGLVGLMEAVDRFDPYKGTRFLTFAVWYIKDKLQKFIEINENIISRGTTRSDRAIMRGRGKAVKKLLSQNQTYTQEELAKELNVSVDELKEYNNFMTYSLNTPALIDHTAVDRGVSYVDLLEDNHNIEEEIEINNEIEYFVKGLYEAMGDMNDREYIILSKRLLAEDPWSLSELAEEFQISKQRVNEIEKKMIKKITNQFDSWVFAV